MRAKRFRMYGSTGGNAPVRAASARSTGFTVLELLVAMSVAAVLTAVAVPGFRHISAQNDLATSTGLVLRTLASARQTAITRNTAVTFCAGNPQLGCRDDGSASEWIVFVDVGHDGEFDANDELRLFATLPSHSAVDVSGNGPFRNAIVFTPEGMAQRPSGAFAAGRLRLCAVDAFTPNATDLVLIGSGRVVTEAHDFAGTCESV